MWRTKTDNIKKKTNNTFCLAFLLYFYYPLFHLQYLNKSKLNILSSLNKILKLPLTN